MRIRHRRSRPPMTPPTPKERRRRPRILATSAAALLASVFLGSASPLLAATATWSAMPTDNNWITNSTENNWSTGVGTFPGSTSGTTSADTAIFGDTFVSNINLNGTVNVQAITFQANITNYTIVGGGGPAQSLILSDTGSIGLTGTASATVATTLVIGGNSATFFNNSTSSMAFLGISGPISGGAAGTTNLTLEGTGTSTMNMVGSISNGAATTLNVSVQGTTWNFMGPNTYTGTTSIAAGGTLIAMGPESLPTPAADGGTGTVRSAVIMNTTNAAPATLMLQGGQAFMASLTGNQAGDQVILNGGTATIGNYNSTSTEFDGVISGPSGTLNKDGNSTQILGGVNTYSGSTNINGGTLAINGSLFNSANPGTVTVNAGGTLAGTGTINGLVSVMSGGVIQPGSPTTPNTPGTLNVGVSPGPGLMLNQGAISDFRLAQAGTVGSGVNDLVNVTGDLTLGGNLNITRLPGFGLGTYTLYTYSGMLNGATPSFSSIIGLSGFSNSISTSTTGQVNLVVSGTLALSTQYWNGTTTAGTGVIQGGMGTWDNSTTNWTDTTGTASSTWQGGTAIFGAPVSGGPNSMVMLNAPISAQSLVFNTTGYTINSPNFALAMEGTTPTITVTNASDTATINATIVGNNGLTVSGAGTLILMPNPTGNLYAGTTSIINGATLDAAGPGALPAPMTSGPNGAAARSAVAMDQTGTGGSTLLLGYNQSIASLTGAASSTVNLNSNTLTIGAASGTTTFAGAFSNTGGTIIKDGPSTQIYSRNFNPQMTNPFPIVNVYGGTLQIGDGTTTAVFGAPGNFNVGSPGSTPIGSIPASTATLAIDLVDGGNFGASVIINSVMGVNTAVNFIQAGTTTVSGTIMGSGGGGGTPTLNQNGTGTTILTASNNIATININNGTLQVGNGGPNGDLGTSTTTVIDSGALTFDRDSTSQLVIMATIEGSGTVNQIGTGTTILAGTSTYAGTTTISAGTLQVGGFGPGGNLGSGPVINNGALVLAMEPAGPPGPVVVSNLISGTGEVDITNNASIELTNNNTYTGPTNVTMGSLTVTGSLAAGSTVNIGDGSQLMGAGTINGNVTIIGEASITGGSTAANGIHIGGNLTANAADIFDPEAGFWDGVGTVNGTLISNSGTFTIQPGGNLITNAGVALSGTGALQVDGTLTSNGPVNVNAGGVLTGTGTVAGTVTVSSGGTIQPSDSSAPGTLTVTNLVLTNGANSVFKLQQAGAVGGGANDLLNVTGNLTLGGNLNITPLPGFGPGSYTLYTYGVSESGSFSSINGLFGYNAAVVTTTPGQVGLTVSAMAGSQFWDGATTTGTGSIQGSDGTWDNSTTNWTNSTGTTNSAWTGGTAFFTANAGAVTLGAPISAQALVFGINGYTIGSPSFALTMTGAAPTIAVTNLGDTAEIDAPIAGSNGLTVTGAGTLVLDGANTYTGGTTITAGTTLFIGNGGTSGNLGAGNVVNNGTLGFGRSDTVTVSNVISGSGGVVQTATGTTILSGLNTYTGTTTVEQGTLQAGSTQAFGSNSAAFVYGTLDLAGFSNTLGSVDGSGTITNSSNGPATLTVGALNTSSVYAVVFTDGGPDVALSLTKVGTGTLTLDGTNSSYTGATNVLGGVLAVGNSGTLSATSSITVASGATLEIIDSEIEAPLTLNGTGAAGQNGALVANASGGVSGIITLGSAATISVDSSYLVLGPIVGGGNALTLTGVGMGRTSTIDSSVPSIIKNGSGTWQVDLTDGYGGAVTVNAGTLQLSNLSGMGTNAAVNLATSLARLDLAFANPTTGLTIGSLTGVAGSVVDDSMGGPQSVTLTTGGDNTNTTFAGVIQNSGGGAGPSGSLVALAKIGTGTFTLTGNNSYNGATTVNAGTLQVGNGTSGNLIGTSGITVADGATLATNLASGATFLPNVNLNGVGAAFSAIQSGTNTIASLISGTGVFNQTGSGTTILTGLNTYSGATNVLAGTLQLGRSGAVGGTSAINVSSGAALDLAGFTPATNAPLNLNGTGIALGGALTNSGTNSGMPAPTYNGPVTLQSATSIGSSTGDIAINGTISGGAGASLTKIGTDILFLNGNNTYSGGTIISAGILSPGSNLALGTGPVTVSAGGDLQLQNGVIFSNVINLANGGGLTVIGLPGSTATYAGAVTVNGGSGTIAAGQNTLTLIGGVNKTGAILVLGGAMGDGGGTININTIGISGSSGSYNSDLVVDSTTANLNTADSYVGSTFIRSAAANGIVNANVANALPNSSDPNLNNRTALVMGDSTSSSAFTTTLNVTSNGNAIQALISPASASGVEAVVNMNGVTFNIGNATAGSVLTGTGSTSGLTESFYGTINGNASSTLIKDGASTQIIVSPSGSLGAFLGTVDVSAGTLQIGDGVTAGASNWIGAVGSLTVDPGATLAVNLANNETFQPNILDNGTVASTTANTQTLSGNITGTGGVSQAGGGTLILSGANSYSGPTNIIAGTIQLGVNNAISTAGLLTINGTSGSLGQLDLNFHNQTISALTIVAPEGSTPSITGAGTLTLNGDLNLVDNTSHPGDAEPATIAAGTLALSAGNHNFNVAGQFTAQQDLTISSTITGSGGVTINATNSSFNNATAGVIFTGSNNYTGTTNVNNGTLAVNGSLAAASTVTVNSGGTLAGTGSVGGTVNVLSGGTIQSGSSLAVGTLAVGNLILNSGSNSDFRLAQAGLSGSNINDLVHVTGNLTLGGSLNITQESGFGFGSYTLYTYFGSESGSFSAINGLPGLFAVVSTAVPNQVILTVAPTMATQYWDGAGSPNDGVISGGIGTWDNTTSNWTNSTGATNTPWQGNTAVFAAPGGTVTLGAPISAQLLIFGSTGYTIASASNALTLTGAATISVTNATDTATISAQLAGTNGLTVNGAGTLILTNSANNLSGAVSVTGATLQIGTVGSAGSLGTVNTVSISNGGTFSIVNSASNTIGGNFTNGVGGTGTLLMNSASAITLSGNLSDGTRGQLALTQSGSGSTILTGTNTYSGTTTINSGFLQVGAGGATATTGTLGSGAVVNNSLLSFARSNTITATNNISGTGELDQDGIGTLILSGTNTYSGPTFVNVGTLQAGSSQAFGTNSDVTVSSGATLELAGFSNTIGSLSDGGIFPATGIVQNTLATGGSNPTVLTIAGTNATPVAFGGTITQSGAGAPLALVKNGTGTQSLWGQNNYSGGTTLNAGTLDIDASGGAGTGPLGTGTLTINGGTIGTGIGTGGLNHTSTISNSVTVNGSFGVSNVVLSTAVLDTSSGNAGTGAGVAVVNSYAPGAGNNHLVSDGVAFSGAVTLNNASVTVINTTSGFLNFTGSIGGASSGGLSFTGNTYTEIAGSASNTYTGLTTVGDTSGGPAGTNYVLLAKTGGAVAIPGNLTITSNGYVQFEGANQIASTSNVVVNGVLDMAGLSQTVNDLSGSGTVRLDSTAFNSNVGTAPVGAGVLTVSSGNFSGTIIDASLGGQLVKNGSGTLTLTGSNTYTGTTTINGGTLQIGSGGTTGTLGTGAVVDNATLVFDRSDSVTISNAISGTGGVSQSGSGSLTLTGNNTYTGATAVNAGTLQVGDGTTANTSIASSGTVQVGASGTLAINLPTGSTFANAVNNAGIVSAFGAGTNTLSGSISGSGGLSVASGTVILTGANTYAGGTAISSGTLQVGNGGTAGSLGTGAVTDSAALSFNRSDAVSVANTISGNGAVNQSGTGTTILTATNTYTGATNVNAGTLQVGNGTSGNLTGTSGVAVANNATLATNLADGATFSPNVNLNGASAAFNAIQSGTNTIASLISGTGALNQNGTGTTILTAANTYSGATTVNAGILEVNGSIANSITTVTSLGTLQGIGSVGHVFNNGTVAPGSTAGGPGTLTVTGNYTQGSGGNLRIGLVSASTFGKLAVNGTASLNGSVTAYSVGSFTPQVGSSFQILNANGGVTGTFSNVVDQTHNAGTLVKLQASYSAMGATLQYVQGAIPIPTSGGTITTVSTTTSTSTAIPTSSLNNFTASGITVAKVINGDLNDPKLAPVLKFLDQLPVSALPAALDRISPSDLSALTTASTSVSNTQIQNIQTRLEALISGISGFTAQGMHLAGDGPDYAGSFSGSGLEGPTGNDGKAVETPAPYNPRLGTFVTGAGEWVTVGNTDTARGYDLVTGGVTLGVDYKLTDNFALGIDAGYAHTGIDLVDNGHSGIDAANVGLYGTYFNGGFYADGAVGGTYNTYDNRRAALQGDAYGQTHGGALDALLATGYNWHVGGLTLGPTGSFHYNYTEIKDYTEHGSLAPMSFPTQGEDSIRSAFGGKATYDWKMGGLLIRPEVSLAWQHEYGRTNPGVIAQFASGAGSQFTVYGPDTGRDSLLVGAGFAIIWSDRFSSYLYYDGELARTNYEMNSITGGLRMTF